MYRTIVSLTALMALLAAPAFAQTAPSVRVCAPGELPQTFDTADAEVAAHRRFDLPVITYPFSPKPREATSFAGLSLDLLVDETGHIACYALPDGAAPATADEQPVIDALSTWTYTPFTDEHGAPKAAYIREYVYEQEAYQKIVPMPAGPASSFSVVLMRSNCLGTCPAYSVSVKAAGDGTAGVRFQGSDETDVTGEHAWTLPAETVTALIEAARTANIWSARDRYRADATDQPTYTLKLGMGGKTKTIFDYAGPVVGIPQAVTRFMDTVDRLSGAADYIRLTPAGVTRLAGEGIDLKSQAGADLLTDATADVATKDDAILALIQAGAPLHGGHRSLGYDRRDAQETAPLPDAIRLNRAPVVAALVDRGALTRDGKPDRKSIDDAFDAAIAAGSLATVRTFWAYHPSLTFTDTPADDGDENAKPVTAPVTLLLNTDYNPYNASGWDGFAIARFLLEQGCDINARGADGRTLLHIATHAGDAAFVRYLLDHGARVDALNADGEAPLDLSIGSDDVSILLLEAGADPAHKPKYGNSFSEDARNYDEKPVLAWLKAHGMMAPLPNPEGGY